MLAGLCGRVPANMSNSVLWIALARTRWTKKKSKMEAALLEMLVAWSSLTATMSPPILWGNLLAATARTFHPANQAYATQVRPL